MLPYKFFKLTQLFIENNRFAVELLRNHAKQNTNLLNKLVILTQKYMPGRVADTLLYLKNNVFHQSFFGAINPSGSCRYVEHDKGKSGTNPSAV
jgi:hypothetical protein